MSSVISIQGKNFTIKDIASAKTALAAAKTHAEILGVLDIANNSAHVSNGAFTVAELTSIPQAFPQVLRQMKSSQEKN
jgi:hypothetical protein